MKKFERPPLPVLVLAIGALGLCVAHFVFGEGAPAPATKTIAQPSNKDHDWSRDEGQLRDAKLMDEFRENRRPSVMDSKDDKQNKDLARALRRYGLNPIEMQGGPMGGSVETLKVLNTPADVKALIDSGGYVAGMRPEEMAGGK